MWILGLERVLKESVAAKKTTGRKLTPDQKGLNLSYNFLDFKHSSDQYPTDLFYKRLKKRKDSSKQSLFG